MRLETLWYGRHPLALLLAPLGWLYAGAMRLRRAVYRIGLLRARYLSVPVVVIGNLSVGGTGKTPLVIWLVETLRRAGHHPGVISRGYGGQTAIWPVEVHADSDPNLVGDEPVLIARRSACPVAVDPDRVRAAETLLARHHCDLIIADDGLQHYRLGRALEIAVVDGVRRYGNGRCLPAGPLREPLSRLRSVDLAVVNGVARGDEYAMALLGSELYALTGPAKLMVSEWRGTRVHAVAGIGNPARFFSYLRVQGLEVEEHPFADHYRFCAADITFADRRPVIMTEKDAIKCVGFATPQHWYLPVTANPDPRCRRVLEQLLKQSLGLSLS